jgi:HEAT repeat protein
VLAREGRGPVAQEAALALALTARERAIPELFSEWARCRDPEDYDAVARAFRLAGGADAIEPLMTIARDTDRTPRERAFAVVALGRITDPETVPLLDRFAPDSNPHSGCHILLDLARHRDAAFLY